MPKVEDGKGAIKDAGFGDCSTDPGTQEVTGSVKNSADEELDYVVTVSWVTKDSDVRARGVAVLEDVAPGASSKFAVKSEVPEGIATCTFHVLRGDVE